MKKEKERGDGRERDDEKEIGYERERDNEKVKDNGGERDNEKVKDNGGERDENITELRKKLGDDDDKLIERFFNHCLKKCEKKEEKGLDYMMVVATLLPYYAFNYYDSS